MTDRKLLLGTLAKLLELPFGETDDHSARVRRQETLDFLAMLSGVKPVFVTGPGFDDDLWIRGAVDLATQMGLEVEIGPMWNALPGREGLPEWFVRFADEGRCSEAVFICKEPAIARKVLTALNGKPVRLREEAELLGYPECCVRAEYQRKECLDRVTFMMLSRAADEDQQKMWRLIDEDACLAAETPAEIAMRDAARTVNMAPYTSINMCRACASDPDSPARGTSRDYEQLAYAIDQTFADGFA
jgi:hypothetical protein